MSVLIQPSRAQPVTGPCTCFEVYKGSQLEKNFPISCARACTVASEVSTEAQSFC